MVVIYRAAFTTVEHTEPLARNKVREQGVALGGEKAQGIHVREMVELVAENVKGGPIADCGHSGPEERRDETVRQVWP